MSAARTEDTTQSVPMKRGSYEFRTVHPAMWRDKEFKLLSLEAKLVWLHCLTGPHGTHFPGLSRTTVREIAATVDLSPRKVASIMDSLTKLGWLRHDDVEEVLFLPNALKYNPPDNEKQLKHWVRIWSNFPECSLKQLALDALRHACDLSPDLMRIIDEEVTLGPWKDRPKPRRLRGKPKPEEARSHDTVSCTVSDTVTQPASNPFTTHHSPLTIQSSEEHRQRPAGAASEPVAKASSRSATPSDAPVQSELLPPEPATRRRRQAEAAETPNVTAQRDAWLARYTELKGGRFPITLGREECVVFASQLKAGRTLEELLWVLETLHADEFSARMTVLDLLSPKAAQRAAGLASKPAPVNRHSTGHGLTATWSQIPDAKLDFTAQTGIPTGGR